MPLEHSLLNGGCEGYEQLQACSTQSLTLLQLILALYGLPRKNFPTVENEKDLGSPDFVVVGGGTSGSVVAGLLSDHYKVVLLEAGDQLPEITEVPAFQRQVYQTNLLWDYRITPSEKAFQLRPNKTYSLKQGKGLGGSLSMGIKPYLRGLQIDFDEWEKQGNKAWTYKSVLKAYKEMENNLDWDIAIDTAYHATGNPLSVERTKYSSVFTKIEQTAAAEIDFPDVDYNANDYPGTQRTQFFAENGRLKTTFNAYIEPRAKNKNLMVVKNALVTKLEVSQKDKQYVVKSVEYEKDGKVKTIAAKKEVILAAGAINTALILQRSGVGPKKVLEEAGIKPVVELPVGENLMDRLSFDGIIFNATKNDDNGRLQSAFREHVETYLGSQRGPLSGVGSSGFAAFLPVPIDTNTDGIPTIQVSRRSICVDDFYANPNFMAQSIPSPYLTGGFIINPILLYPFSRGTVRVDPKNPAGNPLIDLNAFGEERDYKMLVDAAIDIIFINTTKTFNTAGLRLVETPLPGCEGFEYTSREYWECVVKSYTFAAGQPIGTCKMGPDKDKTRCTNVDLTVKGFTNLRVIDGSVIPSPIRANPAATIAMIGHRGAKMILLKNGKLKEKDVF